MKNWRALSLVLVTIVLMFSAVTVFASNEGVKSEQKQSTGYENCKIIEPQFENAYDFYEGFALVQKNGKWAVIDKTGKIVKKTNYTGTVFTPSEGIGAISSNRKYGFINSNGKILVRPIYDEVFDFKDGFAKVVKNKKYGFIDKTGRIIVKPIYDDADDFSEGMALVKKGETYRFINDKGKLLFNVAQQYECIKESDHYRSFNDGLVLVKKKEVKKKYSNPNEELLDLIKENMYGKVINYAFLDKTGKIVIKDLMYEYISDFSDGLVRVCKDSKDGFIDKTGKMVIQMQYSDFSNFNDGVATSRPFDKVGFGLIDKTGKTIVEPQFYGCTQFDEGLTYVVIDKKYGFIDKTGKTVIAPQFDYVSHSFKEGTAIVVKNRQYVFIDKTGKVVLKPAYPTFYSFQEGAARIIGKDGKWGFILRGM